MERKPQTLESHTRLDPLFHFFLVPVALLMVIGALWALITNPGWQSLRYLVFAVWLVGILFCVRTYPIKVQDRIIRLEERLRLVSIVPDALRPRIADLTESQLIALRFAPDEEAPDLVARALNEKLGPQGIKSAIRNWRPDYWRV